MKEIKNVESSILSVPEIEFNFNTVYVRSNIKKETKIDTDTKKNIELWTYDEIQYSTGEYMAILNSKVETLAAENAKLKKVNDEQDALISELLMV